MPKTREDVALKAWELAGKPAVELNGEPLSEAAQAEKWAVESGLMQNDANGSFNGCEKDEQAQGSARAGCGEEAGLTPPDTPYGVPPPSKREALLPGSTSVKGPLREGAVAKRLGECVQ